MVHSIKREQAIPRDGVGLLTSTNFLENIFQPSSISGSDSLEDILDQLRGKQEEDILYLIVQCLLYQGILDISLPDLCPIRKDCK